MQARAQSHMQKVAHKQQRHAARALSRCLGSMLACSLNTRPLKCGLCGCTRPSTLLLPLLALAPASAAAALLLASSSGSTSAAGLPRALAGPGGTASPMNDCCQPAAARGAVTAQQQGSRPGQLHASAPAARRHAPATRAQRQTPTHQRMCVTQSSHARHNHMRDVITCVITNARHNNNNTAQPAQPPA